MLYFNLKPIFAARQIERPFSFLVKLGISTNTAHKILNSDCHIMRVDNLELICKALYCQPSDLMAYKPDPNYPLPVGHPLNDMIPKNDDFQWVDKIKTLPLSKLKEISQVFYQTNIKDE